MNALTEIKLFAFTLPVTLTVVPVKLVALKFVALTLAPSIFPDTDNNTPLNAFTEVKLFAFTLPDTLTVVPVKLVAFKLPPVILPVTETVVPV